MKQLILPKLPYQSRVSIDSVTEPELRFWRREWKIFSFFLAVQLKIKWKNGSFFHFFSFWGKFPAPLLLPWIRHWIDYPCTLWSLWNTTHIFNIKTTYGKMIQKLHFSLFVRLYLKRCFSSLFYWSRNKKSFYFKSKMKSSVKKIDFGFHNKWLKVDTWSFWNSHVQSFLYFKMLFISCTYSISIILLIKIASKFLC